MLQILEYRNPNSNLLTKHSNPKPSGPEYKLVFDILYITRWCNQWIKWSAKEPKDLWTEWDGAKAFMHAQRLICNLT